MENKIYILNMSGCHGNFLTFVLDKFCTSTPDIKENPFDWLGNSHNFYQKSGMFNMIDDPQVKEFVQSSIGKNLILITIDSEILYFERIWLSRAGNTNTDLFSEKSISETLEKFGSKFPAFCKDKNITLEEGYKISFKDLQHNGAVVHDNERKNIKELKNNLTIFFPVSNFFNWQSFKFGLKNIAEKFSINLNISACEEVYEQFNKNNKILRSHDNVELYLQGNKNIRLDILQKAYIDSFS